MYYSVFENSIITGGEILLFFFLRMLVWCTTLQGMLVGSSLCAFSCSTHTHTHQNAYTHHKFASVCVCEREHVWWDKRGGGKGREGKGGDGMGWDGMGRKKGGDDRRFLSIWAFILPEPLKTVVLGWEKIHRGGVLKACGARWRSSRQILSRLKKFI